MARKNKGDGAGYGGGSKWQLPSGSWRVQFYLDKRAHRETWPTEQAADARLEEVRRLKQAAYDVGGGLQTVQAYAEGWLEQRQRSSRAARTLDGDRRVFEGYILPHIGSRRLSEVRSAHLQAALNGIEDDIRARTAGRFQGTRTAQLAASLLDQLFASAVAQRLIPFSPMEGVEVPSYERAEVEPADDAQVASVLLAARMAPLPALWHLYALLGLRRGEALGLRWQDIDFKRRTLRVGQQIQAIGGRLEVVPPKSAASTRLLPLPALAAPYLEARQTEQRRERLKAGPAWHDFDLVFCGPVGAPLWPSTVNHWWYDLRGAARLPGTLTLHHLRHSFTTMLDETAITEATKQAILGHGKKTMTQKYTHPRVEAMRRAVEEVAERVARAMERAQQGSITG
jgi:integrase